jgi:putative transposase
MKFDICRHADLLREKIGFTAQRLMELEVEGPTGAAHGERSPQRITQRNGYRNRPWETRAGTVELRIPKLPKDSYCVPGATPAGRQALAAVVEGAYVHGVSTRSVTTVTVGAKCPAWVLDHPKPSHSGRSSCASS